MNIVIEHTQCCRPDWRGKQERQLGRFFGLSFLFHLCTALLFVAYADRVINRHHQEVLYIELSQSPLPCPARSVDKPSCEAVKKPARAPIPVPVVKKELPPQPVKAPSPPMQQTVFSETAKPMPVSNAEPVSAAPQGNPQPSAAREAGPQSQGSAQASSSGGRSTNSGPAGDVAFGSASGPSFMQRVLPLYPMVARRFNREGKVILRLTIDTGGSLVSVEVLEDPGYGFAAAAVEAVKRSRFLPARHEGRPVTAKAILPIRFTLQGVN
jgi:periplasmic protein TonB